MSAPRRGPTALGALWAVLVLAQLGLPYLPGGDDRIGSALMLFWVVVIAASGCVLTSIAVLHRAWVDDTAELGLQGAFFLGVSVLPLVHGLTTPGVLYGENAATMASVQWAVPMATAAAVPLLIPRDRVRFVLTRWRTWVVGWVGIQAAAAGALLIDPSIVPAFAPGHPVVRLMALAALVPTAALSVRHLRLYEIGRQPASFAVAAAYAAIGAGNLVWVGDVPMTPGFWLAHVLDIVGVLLGTIVAWFAYRRGDISRRVLAPLVARDPLDALELGLEPVVRRFVADLGAKDPITQEHVLRTAETAISVGDRIGLPGPMLRLVGLGALLHDVGKLEIDDAVLNKPERLTDEEFEHIKTHTIIGDRLMLASPGLAPLAPAVRHHHERLDGRGYPDGLAGDQIPIAARIVSVCDAYDAMVHTRQYRTGMGVDRARAVLQEHAGTQWDAEVVEALLELSERGRIPTEPTVLADAAVQVGQSCTHDLPEPALSS